MPFLNDDHRSSNLGVELDGDDDNVVHEILLGKTEQAKADAEFDDDPLVLADRVLQLQRAAAGNTIQACSVIVEATSRFGTYGERFDRFVGRLSSSGFLSPRDVVAPLRPGGKLSMLRKVGEHAGPLQRGDILPLLVPGYSVLYQVALLLEEIPGDDVARIDQLRDILTAVIDRTERDLLREDVIAARSALKKGTPVANGDDGAPPSEDDTNELKGVTNLPTEMNDAPLSEIVDLIFAILDKATLRLIGQDYAESAVFEKYLPSPLMRADSALVVVIPLAGLTVVQSKLLPHFGFERASQILLMRNPSGPNIITEMVCVVAQRGALHGHVPDLFNELGDMPLDAGIADALFPNARFKCELFTERPMPGYTTINWSELPSVR
jgi:hypothetical protein